MSTKYNRYAVSLDRAFADAAKEYKDSWDRLQTAREAYDNAPKGNENEFRRNENEVKRIRLKSELEEAEANFKQKQGEVWKDFEKTKSQLDKDFHEELMKDGILKKDGIDEKGMTLLNSGLMNARDLKNMAQEYDGNATMLKMIAKTATEASEKAKTDDERQALTLIAHDIGNGQSAIENGWENICNISNTYSGQTHRIEGKDGRYVTGMNAHWNDSQVRDMIDNF